MLAGRLAPSMDCLMLFLINLVELLPHMFLQRMKMVDNTSNNLLNMLEWCDDLCMFGTLVTTSEAGAVFS